MPSEGPRIRLISLRECAEQLGVTTRYCRTLFDRSGFEPLFRIHQRAYFMRPDFDSWASDRSGQLCTS